MDGPKNAFVVDLQDEGGFQRLLAGEPQTCGMRSGKVNLAPGKEVGEHSTKEKEEMLIFLNGQGQAIIGENNVFDVEKGQICYIPPQTTHNIKNTGQDELIYIYCVAKAL